MKRTKLAFFALLTSVTITACADSATAPIDPALSRSSGDATAARGSSSSRARIRLETRLSPVAGGSFARASGKAKWDSRNNNTQREYEMEVEDVRPGTEVEFYLNDVKVGSTVTVDALGNARVELSTQLGHAVPLAAAGLRAEVRAGGVVVVTGVFPS